MRLAGADAGQDQRRLAGIGRRRHPGVDAEILRLHDAGPVERGGDALHALAGGGKERRGDQQHDQRAHRDRIEQMQPRARRAGLERIGGAQRLLDMRAPQRARHLILLAGAKFVGKRGRRPVREPAAAIEAAQAVERARQAEAQQRDRRDRDQHDQDEQRDGAPHRRQHEPQAGPRDGEENPDRDRERGESRPEPLPQNGPPCAAQRARQKRVGDLRASELTDVGFGIRRSVVHLLLRSSAIARFGRG